MNDEFELSESQFQSAFDFKAFLFRALSYWKLYILFIGIGVFIVYQQNIRKQQSYRLSTQISIEEESNPLFTSTASLTFNWGGVSGKVQTMMTSLSSRSIHEKVVDNLQFYVSYLKQSRFRKDDVYKEAPFRVELLPNTNQVLNSPIKIVFLDNNTYELTFNFETNVINAQNFTTKERLNLDVPIQEIKVKKTLGDTVILPYFNCTINLAENRKAAVGDAYFIQFTDFDAVVANYKNRLAIDNPKNSAILNLSMVDVNTGKIVDYLNETVQVLSEDQLNRKNQFVTNTINFIDAQLERVRTQLTSNADSLNNYREQNKIYSLMVKVQLLTIN